MIPKLNGLILSGGLSTRMGSEKRLLAYHEKPQEQYLYDLLKPFCEEVFVSINASQICHLPAIEDCFDDMKSPLVGIISAMKAFPNNAWLVIACDMPFINEDLIAQLISRRNPQMKATGFENKAIEQDKKKVFTKWVEQENSQQSISIEPLITIYEPAMFSHFMNAYETKRKSVLRVLQQVEVEKIQVSDVTLLQNINTFDEYQQVKQHVITPRH